MFTPILLSRDEFREGTFARDGHKCVFCDKPAQDAHHIIERRLWEDGGYYLENGASVCGEHHILCETTEISVEEVRAACGITRIVVPQHLYPDQPYDKWGNPILENGMRIKGELFQDESVQKILRQGGVMEQFTHWVKYPRTYHVPWSQGVTSDDRTHPDMSFFEGKRVIVTEKMDGENTTMYSDHFHARSVDSRNHPSRNWAKGFWAQRMGDIPQYWRVCCENLYAVHSIKYEELDSYVMGFSIWDENNMCLSWDETLEYFELMDIPPVKVLYDGIYDEDAIRALYEENNWGNTEGYVMRVADSFHYRDFKHCVGKFVRKDHVQTVKHWMHGQRIETNALRNKGSA